jgi:hypothetical protein
VFNKKCTLLHECAECAECAGIMAVVLSESQTCHTVKAYWFLYCANMSIIHMKAVKILTFQERSVYNWPGEEVLCAD